MPLPLQTIDEPESAIDLLEQITEFSIVSIGVVVYDGQNYTTHQFNMSDADMLMSSELWRRFANGDCSNVKEH